MFSDYPEHDKVSINEATRSAAQEFLDWLYDERGLLLCKWQDGYYQHIDGRRGQFSYAHYRVIHVADDGTVEVWRDRDQYWWVREGNYPQVAGDDDKARLLAEYIGVDYDAFQREKESMFAELRQHAESRAS